MRGFLRMLGAQGRAVLVSSHLMSELEDAAGHLVVVGRGKVIADTSVADLIEAASGERVSLRTADPGAAMAALTRAGAAVAATGRERLAISGLPAADVVSLLSRSGVPFSEVWPHRASLEQAYLDLTADAVEYRAADLVAGPADGTVSG